MGLHEFMGLIREIDAEPFVSSATMPLADYVDTHEKAVDAMRAVDRGIRRGQPAPGAPLSVILRVVGVR